MTFKKKKIKKMTVLEKIQFQIYEYWRKKKEMLKKEYLNKIIKVDSVNQI
jgi:hypothetical protein